MPEDRAIAYRRLTYAFGRRELATYGSAGYSACNFTF